MKIYGVDSWQAIQLAMQFIGRLAARFEEEGWRYYWTEGGDTASASVLMVYADAGQEPPRESR